MVSFEVQATGNLSTAIAGDMTSSATPSTGNETGYAELLKQDFFTIFSPYLVFFVGWLIAGAIGLYIWRRAFRTDIAKLLVWLKTRKDEKNSNMASEAEGLLQGGIVGGTSLQIGFWLRWTLLVIWLIIGLIIAFNAFAQVKLDFIAVIIWPVAIIIVLLLFRRQIGSFMDRLTKIGLKVAGSELNFEAAAVAATTGATPTDRSAAIAAVYVFGSAESKDAETHRKAVDTLLSALRFDENASVKASAAEKLGLVGDPMALPYLIDALKDYRTEVQVSAALALGKIGSCADTHTCYKEAAAEALIAILKQECAKQSASDESKLCKAAKEALERMEESAVDPLFDTWIKPETKNTKLELDTLYLLRGAGGDAFARRLGSELLDDRSIVDKDDLAKELGELRDTRAVEEVFHTLAGLSDTDTHRSKFKQGLIGMGSEALETLFKMWTNPDVTHSVKAREALTEVITGIAKQKVVGADIDLTNLWNYIKVQTLTLDEKDKLKLIIKDAIADLESMKFRGPIG